MSLDPSISGMNDILKSAAPLLRRRQENPTGPLSEAERKSLQEATLLVVRELKAGRSVDDLHDQMQFQGWSPEMAQGFTGLVSQLTSKMYLQRTWFLAVVSVFTGMLASIALPEAAAGRFPWWAAGMSLAALVFSVVAALWSLSLYRRFRQKS